MKLFRNPIFIRLFLVMFLVCQGFSVRETRAQIPVTDFGQIAQNILSIIEETTTAAQSVLSFLHDTKLLEYLQEISYGIKIYKQSKSIYEDQQRILKMAEAGIRHVATDPSLTPTEAIAMVRIYGHFVTASAKNVKNFAELLSPKFFEMTDKDRMDVIDKIEARTIELSHHLNYYDLRNRTYIAQANLKKKELAELKAVNQFYANQLQQQESAVSAAGKIGGFHGTIINLLYAASGIVALIGATRVYGQFTSGNDAVFGTAVNWFGTCLTIVLLTTFIQKVFF